MSKYYLTDWNRVLADVREVLKDNIVQSPSEADKIIVWQDVMSFSLGIAKIAKMQKKPLILMQHGRWGTGQYFYPFYQKCLADHICVWGQEVKNRMIEVGIPAKRIHITSSTIFKHLIPKKKHKGINIVFTPEHWDADVPENHIVYKELMKYKKTHNVNIIVKTVNEYDKKNYENVIWSDRSKPGHLKICAEVLSTADVVVGIMEGTFELLAQVMDIPVIIADIWQPKSFRGNEGYKKYERMQSDAAKYVSLKGLQAEISQQIGNPEELKKQRQKVALNEAGLHIKDPLKEILKVIKYA